MTKLASADGEDFPEAAMRHFDDARHLKAANRFDSALYHLGFVIECSLKTSIMIGMNAVSLPGTFKIHDLTTLSGEVLKLAANAFGASPVSLPGVPSEFAYKNWIYMRYRAAGSASAPDVAAVEETAKNFLQATVGRFYSSGDLP